ncbi:hypothetical protein RHGRI_008411 [Rhododendron griersonianum]|uniref:Uncharacterized protein n=1 Tax=Rhododendron griersonianum TaxID=479676 RepID=A0AAV6L1B2_9ERIC|nr:hypothetical protein RHGRI_008411 [Rhododendron griersonianum]
MYLSKRLLSLTVITVLDEGNPVSKGENVQNQDRDREKSNNRHLCRVMKKTSGKREAQGLIFLSTYEQIWSPPNEGSYRIISCDASMRKNDLQTSLAVIMSDWKGMQAETLSICYSCVIAKPTNLSSVISR